MDEVKFFSMIPQDASSHKDSAPSTSKDQASSIDSDASKLPLTRMLRLDPFRPQKLHALVESESVIRHIEHLRSQYDLPTPEMIANLLNFSLWSNAVDLSRHPEGLSASFADNLFHGILDRKSNILIDDHQAIVALLQSLPKQPEHVKPEKDVTVIIIADNAGMEFISDLLLADVMITSKRITRVEFHVKYHPTFVSDVIKEDVEDTLIFVEKISPILGHRWRHLFKTGAFVTLDHYYYNSYEPYWVVPLDLFVRYQSAAFVISKGDANARRFHGDRAWEFSCPTQAIISYFPVPLMLVRTFKSETVSGLPQSRIEEFAISCTNDWYHSGDYGTIQLLCPTRPIKLSPQAPYKAPIHDSHSESLSASEDLTHPLSGSAPTSITSPLLLTSSSEHMAAHSRLHASHSHNSSGKSQNSLSPTQGAVFAEESDDPLELEIRELSHDDDIHGHHYHKRTHGRRSASEQPLSHHIHHHHHHHHQGHHHHHHHHHHHGHRSHANSPSSNTPEQ
jgi:hypothetical protein